MALNCYSIFFEKKKKSSQFLYKQTLWPDIMLVMSTHDHYVIIRLGLSWYQVRADLARIKVRSLAYQRVIALSVDYLFICQNFGRILAPHFSARL